MSMLNDVKRLFASKNKTNAANMQKKKKKAGASPHSSWYLGIHEMAGVCQMSTSVTNHQPQTWLMWRVVAGTGEFHLQLQE